ncbi:Tim44/TimA family putative adaptor protein [Stakelama sp. CBK3Z-3]|uniref:Tim44/TimA family putative adaptor protein n=1 Tax=Stakelama flava TaxID=2860338 RepID=A0ABS6XS70_9SPHN|nr:Tim44/TimA family putative adaptor protein [Stakelama flava]MBW4332281.1 Tim44/TimA family putative adaptor protein [Stakelama flava]
MLYIVLLAMVAGFLALRLYSVLGKRTGHEQPLPKPAEEHQPRQPLPRTVDAPVERRDDAPRLIQPGAENGVRALVGASSDFDVTQFVDGAKSAYKMILEAFWKGDRDTLDWLVTGDVKQAFERAIDERESAGHVLDNRLVSIERAVIADAGLEGGEARVTVRFDADIAAVTRDADGNVVAGSLSDAVQTKDLWTFARTLRSDDPNWKLIETDEA